MSKLAFTSELSMPPIAPAARHLRPYLGIGVWRVHSCFVMTRMAGVSLFPSRKYGFEVIYTISIYIPITSGKQAKLEIKKTDEIQSEN